ncbi:hypothetical protein LCGC14_2495800, partial [marine sediment metagenome]
MNILQILATISAIAAGMVWVYLIWRF